MAGPGLPNLRTFVIASTIGAASVGVAPNAFAARIGSPYSTKNTEPFQPATGSTLLDLEEQSALEESLARTRSIVRREEVQELFEQFSSEWIADTMNLSDAQSHLIHPSYHKILTLGSDVLPFIFDEMVGGDGARWLPALDVITLGRVNPVLPEHEDDAYLMCEDWLNWAEEHGLCDRSLHRHLLPERSEAGIPDDEQEH